MNVQRRTDTQLVLRESPALPLLIGGIFWVGGLYVLVRERETLIAIVFAIVVGLIVAAFATSTVCEFDRSKGLVTREIKGLLRRSRIQHPLSHIVGLRIERSAAQRSQAFRVVLVLSTGERVPLTTGFTSGKGDKEEIVALIRDFLQLNDVGDVPIPGVVDMVRMMMDPDAVRVFTMISLRSSSTGAAICCRRTDSVISFGTCCAPVTEVTKEIAQPATAILILFRCFIVRSSSANA